VTRQEVRFEEGKFDGSEGASGHAPRWAAIAAFHRLGEPARHVCIADVDKGKIFCIDVPQDYTTERQYVFTVAKLLIYRHALRRYALSPWQKYALNQLIFVGDEF